MSEHTPGPWLVSGTSITTADEKYCIATIEDDGGYQAPPEQREANAKLIRAAPELLGALRSVMEWCELDSEPAGTTCKRMELAKAAIAKATPPPSPSTPDPAA